MRFIFLSELQTHFLFIINFKTDIFLANDETIKRCSSHESSRISRIAATASLTQPSFLRLFAQFT